VARATKTTFSFLSCDWTGRFSYGRQRHSAAIKAFKKFDPLTANTVYQWILHIYWIEQSLSDWTDEREIQCFILGMSARIADPLSCDTIFGAVEESSRGLTDAEIF